MRILNIVVQLILLVFTLIAIQQTYQLLHTHFTHYDDIGVAYSLVMNSEATPNCSKLDHSSNPISNFSAQARCLMASLWDRLFLIPSKWTYAPFQFWLTQYLITPEIRFNYEEIKQAGRLPSFIFYVAGLLSFFFLVIRNLPKLKDDPLIPYILIAVIAFSLEQRIMASQMQSYAIGLLANSLCLWPILKLYAQQNISAKKIAIFSLSFSLAIAMQYQSILLIFSGFSALFLGMLISRRELNWGLKLSALACLTIGISYLFVGNIFNFVNQGINWNAGEKNEYLAIGEIGTPRLLSLIEVIIRNSAYNFYSVISAIELPLVQATYFGLFWFAIFLIGLLYICKSFFIKLPTFVALVIIYPFIYLLLIYFGKLTYSPTRHFLFHLPFIIICQGYGLLFLSNNSYKNILRPFIVLMVFLYCLTSIYQFSKFANSRVDQLSNTLFENVIRDSSPQFILSDFFDIETFFMPSLMNTPICGSWRGAVCSINKTMALNKDHKIRFLWFSKRNAIYPDDIYLSDSFTQVLKYQVEGDQLDRKLIKFTILKNYVFEKSTTQIDLSNKIKNGANEYFIQLIEAQVNFSTPRYQGSEIQFYRPGLPVNVNGFTGISHHEDWGRWTDFSRGEKFATIIFNEDLPANLKFEIEAQPFGNNSLLPTMIRIGDQEKGINIGDASDNIYTLSFNGLLKTKVLEIHPPSPLLASTANPKSDDKRVLGIGLIRIKITPLN